MSSLTTRSLPGPTRISKTNQPQFHGGAEQNRKIFNGAFNSGINILEQCNNLFISLFIFISLIYIYNDFEQYQSL